MWNSKVNLAVACLAAGFLFANVIHRPRVDLNMDGAPPVSVPGYTGPIYDAKGKLVGYAQPRVVNLTSPIPQAVRESIKPVAQPAKLAATHPPQPHPLVTFKPLTLR